MARSMLKSFVGGNQISEYENSDEKRAQGNKKSLKILMNNTYNNNVQTFCNYRVQAHSGACNPISGAQRPPLTLL